MKYSIHFFIRAIVCAAFALVVAGAHAAFDASDNACNSPYGTGNFHGQNGGTGFNAWSVSPTANGSTSGAFAGNSNGNGGGGGPGINGPCGRAFALYANSGALATAVRVFGSGQTLQDGQVFQTDIDNGFHDGSNTSAGFGLQNSSAVTRFEIFHRAGNANYFINDSVTDFNTGIPFTDGGLRVTFTLTGVNTYNLTVVRLASSQTFTFTGRTLGGTSGSRIDRVRYFYFNNFSGGSARDYFFNNMSISCAGVPACTITQTGGSNCTGTQNSFAGPGGTSGKLWTLSANTSGASIVGAANANTVTVDNGATAGSYTLNLRTTLAGCTNTCSTTITVNPTPSCTVSPASATVCAGQSQTFTANVSGGTGPFSYTWVGPGGFTASSQSINVNVAGTYTVTVSDSKGCVTQCSATLNVNPLPPCAIGGNDPVCTGTSGNIYTGPSGPNLSYSWSIAGNGSLVGSTTAQSVEVLAGSPGSFTLTLTVTDTSSGCQSTCDKTVAVSDSPPCTIAGANAVCEQTTGNLYTGPSGSGLAYSWTITGNGAIAGPANQQNVTVTAGGPGSFELTLTVSGIPGCPVSVCSKSVTVNAHPSCSITGADLVCRNSTGNTYTGPAGMSSYSWSIAATPSGSATIAGPSNANTVSINVGNTATSFTLSLAITDANGCSSSCDKTVSVDTAVPVITSQPVDIAVCTGHDATFSVGATDASAVSYAWRKRGTGWGAGNGWTRSAPSGGCGGFFVGTSAVNDGGDPAGNGDIDTAGKAWGLFNNCGTGSANETFAQRTFGAPIQVGETFKIDMDNGFIQTGGVVGFRLQTSGGTTRFVFQFIGGNPNYTINDTTTNFDTGIPFTGQGLRLEFTLTSPSTYTLVVHGIGPDQPSGLPKTFNRTLAGSPSTPDIVRVRMFNQNAGSGPVFDAFFNSISVGCKDDNAAAYSTSTWVSGSNLGNAPIDGAPNSPTFTIVGAQPSDAGSYDVCVVDACNQSTVSAAATLTVNALPTCTISGSTAICAGQNTTLTAPAGMASYAWSGPGGFSASTQSITVNTPGSYSVTITDNNGCQSSCSVTLTSSPLPAATITAPAAVCEGTTGNTASAPGGAASYNWTVSNGTITAGQGTSSITWTAGSAGSATISVTVTSADGCVNSDSVSVTINATPSAAISAPSAVCAGSTGNTAAVADAGAGASYAWTIGNGTITGGQGTPSIQWTAGSPGSATLNVTVTTAAGCSASGSHNVTVNANTVITSQPVSATRCTGESVTFSVTATGTSLTYQWRKDGNPISGATGTSYTIASVNTSHAGSYDVVVTGVCGTETSVAATLTVNTPPAITQQPVNTSACVGSPASFSVTATGTDLQYSWRKRGAGWGAGNGWTRSAPSGGCGGFFVGTSAVNDGGDPAGNGDIDTAGKAWGLFNNCGTGSANETFAQRTFGAPIQVGETFKIDMDNGFIQTGGVVGFRLQTSGGTTRFVFQFIGGNPNYTINDTITNFDTGIPFTGQGLRLEFTLTSASTYTLVVHGIGPDQPSGLPKTFNRTLAGSPSTPDIVRVRMFNQNAGSGPVFDAFFNSISVGCKDDNAAAYSTSTWVSGSNLGNAPIDGAPSSPTYSIASVTAADAGSYDVCIVGVCKPDVTSSAATLTVNPLPACSVTGPGTVCPTSSANFSAPAGMASYSWSVTGNGTIVGSSASQSVTVEAGSANNSSYTVSVTITDNNGCSSACDKTVDVADNSAPAATCPPGTSASADANCQAAVPDVTAGVNASDDCTASGALSVTQSPAAGTLVGLGAHTITVTVTDAAGNSTQCTTSFTVNDTTAPSLTCAAPKTASANANCQAPVPDFTADSSATDNCSPVSKTQSPVAGTLVGLGTHTVTVTATDAAGNSSQCTTSFTVVDTTPPSVSCPAPTSASADANCKATIPDVTGGASASDNCSPVTLTQSPAAGTVVGLGAHTITVTATDAAGNSSQCTTTFTVNDTTPPSVTCPAPSSAPADANCSAVVPDVTGGASASDNCSPVTLTQSPAAGTVVGLGTHVITVTATDATGNSSQCTTTFTVQDESPAAVSCPAPATASANANCQAAVPDLSSGVTAADNCSASASLTVSQEPAPGTLVGLGTHTITIKVVDGAGNSSQCTTTFTVNDTTAPTGTCPAGTSANADENCKALVPDVTGGVSASDNCSAVSKSQSPAPGTPVGLGTHLITVTLTDAAGNSSDCTTTFTVVDATAPVITSCPAHVTVQCASQVPAANPSAVSATDNCSAVTVTHEGDAISNQTCANRYTITRTYKATDAAGNSATCAQTITVNDTTAPSITAPADVFVQGVNAVPPADFAGGSASDNCGGNVTVTHEGDSQVANACGIVITRTYRATDDCGNSATATQIITVGTLLHADAIIWHAPLAQSPANHDTDPSNFSGVKSGGLRKYVFRGNSTIPIKVHVQGCSSPDVTTDPTVTGFVAVYADNDCNGIPEGNELLIDYNGVGGTGGAMDKINGHLQYNLDSRSMVTRGCYVLRVTINAGSEQKTETVLLERR